MNIMSLFKRQTTPEKFTASTVRLVDVYETRGKERPFNFQNSIAQYRSWVYSAAWLNSQAVSTVPIRMYVRSRSGRKLWSTRPVDKRRKQYILGQKSHLPSMSVLRKAAEWGDEFEELNDGHPILNLLHKPCPGVTGFEFSALRILYLQLLGNYYMHVVESPQIGNLPTQLWTVPAQHVKIEPAKPGSDHLIEAYWYGKDSLIEKRFPVDEIRHLKMPNPKDIYYGLGKVEAGWDVLKLHIAQRETDQAKYDNQSRPDLVVTTKSAVNATPDQLKTLQEDWARIFRGTFRQGSPVFLTGDTTVLPLNWAPSEIGDKEITVEEIAAVMGVPVSMLKANDPNLASAQTGFASWRENTILPYCRMDEEFLNANLIDWYGLGDDAFLCYDDPVPENRTLELAEMTFYASNGVKTRNELRRMIGEEPFPDSMADTLLVPAGLQPIDMVGTLPMGMPAAPMSKSVEEPVKPVRGGGGIILQSDHYMEHLKADVKEPPEKPIKKMISDLRAVFNKQYREALRIASGKKDKTMNIAEMLKAMEKYVPEIREAMAPYIEDQLINGTKAGLDRLAKLGVNMEEAQIAQMFDVTNPLVAEFARSYTMKLAGDVNQTTIESLSQTLASGLEEGETSAQLAKRIGEVFDSADGYRSEMIARTESSRAYVAGTTKSWKESGVVEGKKWQLANSSCKVCQAIRNATASRTIAVDEPFLPLGAAIPIPGGKTFVVNYMPIMGGDGHPHDRCSVDPVLVENKG